MPTHPRAGGTSRSGRDRRNLNGKARRLRRAMVENIRSHQVASEQVLAAMEVVPRHAFTPGHSLSAAYDDRPLPIGLQQTISQPLMVAWMATVAEVTSGDRVLEVGAGSGYGAAVLGHLAHHVVTTERIAQLADTARATLAELDTANVTVVHTDGTEGWPAQAPYDAIVVTAAAPAVPEPLIDQLAEGGRLVVPVGDRTGQQLVRVRRNSEVTREELGWVAFVPLVGSHGWDTP